MLSLISGPPVAQAKSSACLQPRLTGCGVFLRKLIFLIEGMYFETLVLNPDHLRLSRFGGPTSALLSTEQSTSSSLPSLSLPPLHRFLVFFEVRFPILLPLRCTRTRRFDNLLGIEIIKDTGVKKKIRNTPTPTFFNFLTRAACLLAEHIEPST